MLFIDFVTLMLLNMAAGLVELACFLIAGLNGDRKSWAAAFGVVGLVALVCGFRMAFTWPLPGSYNSAFGESSVLLGAIYLAIAFSLAFGWSLKPLAIYGAFAGASAVVLGVCILRYKMTMLPQLSALGFVATGAGGILAMLAFCVPSSRGLRSLAALALLGAALVWSATVFPAYFFHMEGFAKWTPQIVETPPAAK